MKILFTLGLAFLGAATLTTFTLADDAVPKPVLADSFALKGDRKAGAPLAGVMPETGATPWGAIGTITFWSAGGITVADSGTAATAVIPLDSYDGSKPIQVVADVNPIGSGHVALALLSALSPGDYWKNVVLFMALGPTGNVQIYSDKVANRLFVTTGDSYDFKPADYNHVELTYNPKTQTVSASVNGKQLAKEVPVVTPPAAITGVALHFNEQITANQPGIKNFQVFVLP